MNVTGHSANARRTFVNGETMRLGRFLDLDDRLLVGWRRSYRCECGLRCTSSGDISDHTLRCRVQQEVFT